MRPVIRFKSMGKFMDDDVFDAQEMTGWRVSVLPSTPHGQIREIKVKTLDFR